MHESLEHPSPPTSTMKHPSPPTSTLNQPSPLTSTLNQPSPPTITPNQPIIIVHPCTQSHGPNTTLGATLLEIFHILFPVSLISMIADKTNLIAEQVLSSEAFQKFEPVITEEIQAYFGFMLLMGINKVPCLYDYWKKDTTYFAPITE